MRNINFKKYKKGERPSAQEHNRMTSLVSGMAGSWRTNSFNSSEGVHIRRMPTTISDEAPLRTAKTTEDAGAKSTILANLVDSNGVEYTSGDFHDVTVICNILGGGDLNIALPLLADGTGIIVEFVNTFVGASILTAHVADDYFIIEGYHQFTMGVGDWKFRVSGSTGNDGIYTIVPAGAELWGSDTKIFVVEEIPDGTVDGVVENFWAWHCRNIFQRSKSWP